MSTPGIVTQTWETIASFLNNSLGVVWAVILIVSTLAFAVKKANEGGLGTTEITVMVICICVLGGVAFGVTSVF